MTASFEFAANRPLPDGQRQAICDWLRSVGVDPALIAAGHIRHTASGYDLHLIEHVVDEDGSTRIDPSTAEVVTRNRIVQLGPVADWPGAEVAGGDHPGDFASGA